MTSTNKPCVLVFAGSDPSGGAGISADIEAIAAQNAHAMPIITAITVQDNDRVYAVEPVSAELILEQARVIANKIPIHAIKIGIVSSRANAQAIASWISDFKKRHLGVPVLVDPVLASGHGYSLGTENPIDTVMPLLKIATIVTPNLFEADRLSPRANSRLEQAQHLMALGAENVLIKGGHGIEPIVTNSWFHGNQEQHWQWTRLAGTFHGSGCTLASAIAGQLAHGNSMQLSLETAQAYCHRSLQQAYSITYGQLIPKRIITNQ